MESKDRYYNNYTIVLVHGHCSNFVFVIQSRLHNISMFETKTSQLILFSQAQIFFGPDLDSY